VLTNPEDLGDRLTLPHRHVRKPESELAASFGGNFAGNLADLEVDKWQGPILSGYGLHLVFIEEVVPGRPLTLEEAERDVRRDWDNEQRVKAIDALYEQFRSDYTITIEPIAEGDAES
jgi:hypothetical protein